MPLLLGLLVMHGLATGHAPMLLPAGSAPHGVPAATQPDPVAPHAVHAWGTAYASASVAGVAHRVGAVSAFGGPGGAGDAVAGTCLAVLVGTALLVLLLGSHRAPRRPRLASRRTSGNAASARSSRRGRHVLRELCVLRI